MSAGNKKNKCLQKVYNYEKEHPLITYLVVHLSGIWGPIVLTYFGLTLKLIKIDNDRTSLTVLGVAALLVLFCLNSVAGYALSYYQSSNKKNSRIQRELENEKKASEVFRNMSQSSIEIHNQKTQKLLGQAAQYEINTSSIPPELITSPEDQLSNIANEISLCFAKSLAFENKNDLFTSIAYRFPTHSDSNWKWASAHRGLPFSKLLNGDKKQKSTFQHLIQSRGHIAYFESKQYAFENHLYIPDDDDVTDSRGHLKGSIACYQFSKYQDELKIVEYVISISSYNRKFADSIGNKAANKTIRKNLTDVIIPFFQSPLESELCLLYMQKTREERLSR